LGSVINSEQLAEFCLHHALDFWFADQPQLAMHSLSIALRLKRTTIAQVLRDFIVQKQTQQAFALLLAKRNIEAKQMLYLLHELHPRNKLVKQLQAFTDSLLTDKA
jgi:hypothetical protein